jgi:hypothetical protein
MPIPHKGHYPPSGTVEVTGDPRWTWDGRAWHHNGRVATPARGTAMRGKAGTDHAGWYYDWPTYAWMEPDHAVVRGPSPGPGGAPVIHINQHHPAPPVHQPQHLPVHHEHGGEHMSNCDHHGHDHKKDEPGLIKGLMKHPVIPAAGVLALIIPQFIKEPTAPPITSDTPPWLASLYQTIYDQNRDKYRDSRETWNNVGQALLTIGSAQMAISQNDAEQIQKLVQAVQKRPAQHVTHPAAHHVAAGHGHGAM